MFIKGLLLCSPTFPQSCFDLPTNPKDVRFDLSPDYVLTLPKFIGFEYPYLFISKFDEICSLIHMPRVSNDVVRMKFILFALKDDTKR